MEEESHLIWKVEIMDQFNVGVIGTGKMGLLHSGIFNSLEGSKLAAISEKDTMMSTVLKKYLNEVNVYKNYEKMFEKEDLDIIVITTPVFLHKDMIEDAISQGLNVFVEKPLALNSEECNSILNKKNHVINLVGYCRRFMETYNLVKELIDESIMGNVNFFKSQLFVEQVFNKKKDGNMIPIKVVEEFW